MNCKSNMEDSGTLARTTKRSQQDWQRQQIQKEGCVISQITGNNRGGKEASVLSQTIKNNVEGTKVDLQTNKGSNARRSVMNSGIKIYSVCCSSNAYLRIASPPSLLVILLSTCRGILLKSATTVIINIIR